MKKLQHSYSDMFIFTGKCVHWPMQSPTGVGHLEILSYALKTQLTSSRCRTKNTDSLSDNKTHYNLSESLSLSHTDILLTRHSLQWHTSLKSPNCDLPVKKQTILLCHTDTHVNTQVCSQQIAPVQTQRTVTATRFVRVLRVAILREYISQGKYSC